MFHSAHNRELQCAADDINSFLQTMLLRPFLPLTAYVDARLSDLGSSTMLSRFEDLSIFVSWYCVHDIARYCIFTFPMDSFLFLFSSVRPELQMAIKDCIRGMRRKFRKLQESGDITPGGKHSIAPYYLGLRLQQQEREPLATFDDLNDDDVFDWDLLDIAAIATADGETDDNAIDIHSLSSTPLHVTPSSSMSIPTAAVVPVQPAVV